MQQFGGFNAPPPPPSTASDDDSDSRSFSEGGFAPFSVVGVDVNRNLGSSSTLEPVPEVPVRKSRGVTFSDRLNPRSSIVKPRDANGIAVGINMPRDQNFINPSPRPLFVRQPSLTRSLGACMNPTCTTCPPEYHRLRNQLKMEKTETENRKASQNLKDEIALLSDSDDDDELSYVGKLGRKIRKCLTPDFAWGQIRGIFWTMSTLLHFKEALNPNINFVRYWNQFFLFSMIVAFAVDPLFFFVTSIDSKAYCIFTEWENVYILTVFRSVADIVYFLHMLLQFRLAYKEPAAPKKTFYWWGSPIAPKNPGELNFDKKQVALNYLKGWFVFDLMGLLPLPQVFALLIIPKISAGTASIGANVLRACILLQYIPRGRRCFGLVSGTSTGFMFESAWASFALNLIMYIMSSHIVGALWFLGATERFYDCAKRSCSLTSGCRQDYLNCPSGLDTSSNAYLISDRAKWASNTTLPYDCAFPGIAATGQSIIDYNFGLFELARPLFLKVSFFNKYIYALQWGFQQISTLGGNQVPSPFVPEVLFMIFITGGGLLLFAVLIGNIQTFLQSLTRRTFEFQLHRRDVEQWMQRRNIPRNLAKKVRDLERLQWAANKGVDESEVLGSLSEDLQKEVRRHLCLDLILKSKLFSAMDDAVLDYICERLVHRIYIDGTMIMKEGFPVSRMFFVVKGQLQSVTTAGGRTGFFNMAQLSDGDFFGEELLITYLEEAENNSNHRARRASRRFLSRGESGVSMFGSSSGGKMVDILPNSERTVTCIGPVEGFSLEAEDLEFMCRQFSKTLLSDEVQRALNQCSKSRQTKAAITIQLRYRSHLRKRLGITLGHFQLAQREKRVEGVVKKALEKPGKKIDVFLNPGYSARPPNRGRET